MSVQSLPSPTCRLSLGVTGHRCGNSNYIGNAGQVAEALGALFEQIDALVADIDPAAAATRLHSLLANGVDQLAAEHAIAHGWELVAPLPFGCVLNRAIQSGPRSRADAVALLAGREPADEGVAKEARAIFAHEKSARLFELNDQDDQIADLFLATFDDPAGGEAVRAFHAQNSQHVALAGRVMIEQCDLVIGVWDGVSHDMEGGTGHTIHTALTLGTPVLLIDPVRPHVFTIVSRPEELCRAAPVQCSKVDDLRSIIEGVFNPNSDGHAPAYSLTEKWRSRSGRLWLGYRLIETLFGDGKLQLRNLSAPYEEPQAVAAGSGAQVLAASREVPGADRRTVDQIADAILPDFAWFDGIATYFSDKYRSAMVANFVLASLAVLVGLAYQPFGLDKWIFAGLEFFLIATILVLTWLGNRRCWHERWFDNRRVAEYLRHSPVLLQLGIARPQARWPRGSGASWPEHHARHRLREIGLPGAGMTCAYLRSTLAHLLRPHVVGQRDYHRAKTKKLDSAHRRLDKLAQGLFVAAFISVSLYLALEAFAALGLFAADLPERAAKIFTFLGVAFPTLAANAAAIRFFGDFERFAAISEVTAKKLDAIAERIDLLLDGPEDRLKYAAVAEIGRAIEEVTISEIESWQAVFGGKHISLPA